MKFKNIRLPKAVFWDWDGTLVDSCGFLNDAHNHTRRQFGMPAFEEGEYQKKYFGKPRDILYPLIYGERSGDATAVFQKYVEENSHKIPVIEGAKEVLDQMHDKGIIMGVVSNKRADLIQIEIRHHGWDKYFQTIVGAGDASNDKPSGDPLRLAIERCNLSYDPSDIWYMGDTENDLSCAADVGCPAIFLEGHENSESLKKLYKPIFSFRAYSQLHEFLVAL